MPAEVFYSCRAPLPADWAEQIRICWESFSLPWSRVKVSGDLQVHVADDEGHAIALDFARDRPAGTFEAANHKMLLSVLRIAQITGCHLAYADVTSLLDPTDVPALRAVVAPEISVGEFEDLAFAIGLVPRAFRFRHLAATLPSVDISM